MASCDRLGLLSRPAVVALSARNLPRFLAEFIYPMSTRQYHRDLTFNKLKYAGCDDYAGPRGPKLPGIGKSIIFFAFLWA